MTKTNVHIGGSFAETKHRVLDAVARYRSGESQGGERHLTFDDLETFMKVFTPKRVELVRHAKHHCVPQRAGSGNGVGAGLLECPRGGG